MVMLNRSLLIRASWKSLLSRRTGPLKIDAGSALLRLLLRHAAEDFEDHPELALGVEIVDLLVRSRSYHRGAYRCGSSTNSKRATFVPTCRRHAIGEIVAELFW